jgi:hypothetical protein
MAKSDLLKEAIADARAVKETAVANAKIALQEAFAPRIQRMISDQIENELDSEEGMPAEEPAMDDMGDMGAEEAGEDFNWVDNNLSAEVGGDTYDFEVGMAGEEGEMEPEMGAEELPMEEPQSDEEMQDEYNEGYDERDLDLESIIRELEGDMEPEMEAEDDLTMEGEDASMNKYSDLEESDDMNIDEIIESILREEDEMEDVPAEEDSTELDEAKEELEEAYKTVRQLKSIINEVNLLNAKLLYTNKLFRNFELSEGQKMKVIENFDRAANTREVKLVFSTLAESFNRPTKKRVVKESYASKPTATTAPKNTNVITEGFAQAERWKKLAGLL